MGSLFTKTGAKMYFSAKRPHSEDDLVKRQQEHLKKVNERFNKPHKTCAHDMCNQCHGTGIKLDGSACIHMLYCSCPKCLPRF